MFGQAIAIEGACVLFPAITFGFTRVIFVGKGGFLWGFMILDTFGRQL